MNRGYEILLLVLLFLLHSIPTRDTIFTINMKHIYIYIYINTRKIYIPFIILNTLFPFKQHIIHYSSLHNRIYGKNNKKTTRTIF
jgi:hypothetical protein